MGFCVCVGKSNSDGGTSDGVADDASMSAIAAHNAGLEEAARGAEKNAMQPNAALQGSRMRRESSSSESPVFKVRAQSPTAKTTGDEDGDSKATSSLYHVVDVDDDDRTNSLSSSGRSNASTKRDSTRTDTAAPVPEDERRNLHQTSHKRNITEMAPPPRPGRSRKSKPSKGFAPNNPTFSLSGAQPPELIIRVIRKLVERRIKLDSAQKRVKS